MKDFIIVGRGLAATVMMHTLHQKGLSFHVVGATGLSSCSHIAAGIWNPVVFKRMTKSWMADSVIPVLKSFYTGCESLLNKKLFFSRQIIKPFTEEQEKKLWIKKASGDLLDFIEPEIYPDDPAELVSCRIPNGYGIVKDAGTVDVQAFIGASEFFFRDFITEEIFEHVKLSISPSLVRYKNFRAKNILFCEGHLVSKNPFFSWIPLKPAKGEILTVYAPALDLGNSIFSRNGFIFEHGAGKFRMGATFSWQELDEKPSAKGLGELENKLNQMISCGYRIMDHKAGIRPSSADRRPIIGPHPAHGNLFVFNGFGTKGVMLAPWLAENFVNFYLQKELLQPEVMVNRFYHLYEEQK